MKVDQSSAYVAFSVAMGVAFFSGRSSFSSTTPFSHADVINSVEACEEGNYIAGCTACSTCDVYEYAAGGCSYFKDTFCTLCEPISNCPQMNIECTAKDDERCVMCDPGYFDDDCKPCSVCDPGYYESQRCTQISDTECSRCTTCGQTDHTVVACTYYEDTVCESCRLCMQTDVELDAMGNQIQGPNSFQAVQCETVGNMGFAFPRSVYTVGADTVCQVCAEPVDGEEYVTGPCVMYGDTQIESCNFCECQDLEKYQQYDIYGWDFYPATFSDSDMPTLEEAWGARLKFERDIVEDAQAALEDARIALGEANRTEKQLYAVARVDPANATKNANWRASQAARTAAKAAFDNAEQALIDAQVLPEERTSSCQRRTQACVPGNYSTLGVETQCTACTPPAPRNNQGLLSEWEIFACFGESDALYQPCSTCQPGEYTAEECTVIGDASCPDCNINIDGTYLVACSDGELRCEDDEATTCVNCKENFYGDTCCYHKYHGACGSITTRERAANRGGFEGSTSEEFILFCMELCDEFPDCTAFELRDDGTDLDTSGPTEPFVNMHSTCYFKAAFSQEDCNRSDQECDWETRTKFSSADPSLDCYSNVCRQNAAFMTYYPEAYPVDGKPEDEEP